MATSTDGLHWERPKLGLVEYGGNKANNILYASAEGERNDGVSVCHDERIPCGSGGEFMCEHAPVS